VVLAVLVKGSQCKFLRFCKENDFAIFGAILITAVGFNWTGYGFGWMLRSTVQQLVIDAAVAAPICPN
jgi:hypothetical protein